MNENQVERDNRPSVMSVFWCPRRGRRGEFKGCEAETYNQPYGLWDWTHGQETTFERLSSGNSDMALRAGIQGTWSGEDYG